MIYAGIDPGATGAIAILLEDDLVILRATKDPTQCLEDYIGKLVKYQKIYGSVFVGLEQQHAMPHQGRTSTFTIGRRFGQLEGMLISFKFPHILVRAKEWQKTHGLTKKYNTTAERKAAHIETARRMFPSVDIMKSHDGVADALLIAEHTRRLHNKGLENV